MKKVVVAVGFLAVVLVSVVSFVFGRRYQQAGYIMEHEKDIAKEQPSPHNGVGMSTGYSFFANAQGLKLTFRKRVLKKGSSIGYHLQKEDEIYYIVSGMGIMKMNNDSFAVKAGDGILTRPGSSHGLQQTGDDDLVIIINYPAD
ncbi:MAG: cupin protein [Segetibacter sp.]|nr:cupin protein [Segetibacter sp.]